VELGQSQKCIGEMARTSDGCKHAITCQDVMAPSPHPSACIMIRMPSGVENLASNTSPWRFVGDYG
jgi:hypothetical protein